MKRYRLILLSILVVALCGCARRDLVRENIQNAKVQLGALLETSEAGDTIRIPGSFEKGEVHFTRTEGWTSGFFAGSLWYMYELTGDEFWATHAARHTEVLSDIQYLTKHHDIGFMIADSYGNGLRLKGTEAYKEVIVNAARSLCTRFRPGAGIIQSWNTGSGWIAKRGWQCPVIIDNMMNLNLLFEATRLSGDSTFFKVAVSHADVTMANHFRPDYSTFHVLDYDPQTGEVLHRETAQGYAHESAWARGQAWALYGYTETYRNTGYERYLAQAEHIAEFLFNHPRLPEDLVPYWDYDCPDIPNTYRDVSSAAIMASACYELFSITGKDFYKEKADKILESLSSPAYRAAPGTNGGFLLMHSVGSLPHGNGIDIALNYADYYFLEALCRKSKLDK